MSGEAVSREINNEKTIKKNTVDLSKGVNKV
jgi:hypothetical protein